MNRHQVSHLGLHYYSYLVFKVVRYPTNFLSDISVIAEVHQNIAPSNLNQSLVNSELDSIDNGNGTHNVCSSECE